ncbi:hypothetical protein DFP72DRAFT_1069133 [Ephemerocybe angulata]|uniref:Uncharacterized protein n=1 Tax=Ephemerocybe angulata TaxID=980116 RepID=A0A8H6HX22_9AGAR|nr:hypothetical protein DFP72DRAFT_1069133 [Tulosesus angulatus]
MPLGTWLEIEWGIFRMTWGADWLEFHPTPIFSSLLLQSSCTLYRNTLSYPNPYDPCCLHQLIVAVHVELESPSPSFTPVTRHTSLLSFIPHILFPSLPWSSSSSSSSSWTTLSNDVLAVVVVVAFDGSSSSSGFLVDVVDNGRARRLHSTFQGNVEHRCCIAKSIEWSSSLSRYPMTATHSAGRTLTYALTIERWLPVWTARLNEDSQRQTRGVWRPRWRDEGAVEGDATTTMPMVRWERGVRSDTGKTASGSDGHSTLRSLQVGRVG